MDNGASSYRRFLNGDDEGLTLIIKEYKDGLILYLNGFVNNIYVAEEIMEETFFKLAVKKPKFNAKSSFKTWLYTIGRNVAIDYLRRNSKLSAYPIEDMEKYVKDETCLENLYIKNERKVIIHKALSDLRLEYRQVLWLCFFEEFSNEETAQIMGKSKRQIENLIYRAKQSLKLLLDKEGFQYEKL
ncbi:MAG: RNA polymerase sigma factor [Alphaproteobacteria bacterium]|nr:RNA polymerase sigma factor [Alphaproteobacteria bacterium]